MYHDFANAVRELWRTFADVFDPYRPELHYMRGPGPKWRAKRAGIAAAAAAAAAAAPAATQAVPSLNDIANVRA